MSVHELRREQWLPVDLERVFEFFSVAHNLERITPPFLRFELRTPAPIEMATGTQIDYRLRLHGIPLRWRSRIEEWEPGRMFVDRQVAGPYRLWHHRHEFSERDGGTFVRDTVRYELPLPPLGDLALPFVRRDLQRIFAYRQQATERLLVAGG